MDPTPQLSHSRRSLVAVTTVGSAVNRVRNSIKEKQCNAAHKKRQTRSGRSGAGGCL